MVNASTALKKVSVERTNINVLHSNNVLKIPRWTSLLAVGNEPGMEGNIMLNRLTRDLCYHDGISWRCLVGGCIVCEECGLPACPHVIINPDPSLGVDVGLTLQPSGLGALTADCPDGTAVGGDCRGDSAVDWQMSRNAATQVASGNNSFLGGGANNTASGTESVIGGGGTNTASATWSGILAGELNTAIATNAIVSGGSTNTATATNTGVLAGNFNFAGATNAVVGGGVSNTSSGVDAVIGGGQGNSTIGIRSGILAGFNNMTTVANAVVVGGDTNEARGTESGILAGNTNTASSLATNAVVVGGNNSTASGVDSIVGAGAFNTALSASSGVLAGFTNSAADTNAAVVCGSSNTASGFNCVVGGGSGNTAAGISSGVLAGLNNSVTGTHSSICAGTANTIASPNSNSAIVAGTDNTILGGIASSSILAGNDITINFLNQAAFTKDLALEASAASPVEGTHIYSAQPTLPGVVASSGVPVMAADSTDTTGLVVWTPAVAGTCTVSYTEAYTPLSLPMVMITPRTSLGATSLFVSAISTASFTVSTGAGGGQDFMYYVIAKAPVTAL